MRFFLLSICLLSLYSCIEKKTTETAQVDTPKVEEAEITDPTVTEVWEPVPPMVKPATATTPPSDAVVLFDGTDLDAWQKPQFTSEETTIPKMRANIEALDANYEHPAADWTVENGTVTVLPKAGAIETKQAFGDCQLHIEWNPPVDEGKGNQAYSNSGVFFMGLYEVQVLNTFNNKTYSNGQAGAVYKQHIPLVNPANPPGEWQTYDIIFTAPRFEGDKLLSPAYATVLFNGVLVQNHVELEGPTAYIGRSSYFPHAAKLPLRLQDHGDKVQFRNIWVREL